MYFVTVCPCEHVSTTMLTCSLKRRLQSYCFVALLIYSNVTVVCESDVCVISPDLFGKWAGTWTTSPMASGLVRATVQMS